MGLPEQNMKLSSVKDGLVKGSTVLDAIIKQLVEEFGDEYEIYKEPQNQNAADDFVYEDFVDVVEKEKNEQKRFEKRVQKDLEKRERKTRKKGEREKEKLGNLKL